MAEDPSSLYQTIVSIYALQLTMSALEGVSGAALEGVSGPLWRVFQGPLWRVFQARFGGCFRERFGGCFRERFGGCFRERFAGSALEGVSGAALDSACISMMAAWTSWKKVSYELIVNHITRLYHHKKCNLEVVIWHCWRYSIAN